MASAITVQKPVLRALMILSVTSMTLFLIRVVSYRDFNFWYLNWNLLLAWLPLLFAGLLLREIQAHSGHPAKAAIYGLLWLGFLPNSFYLVTDFIHLQESTSTTLLFDVLLLFSFTLSGFSLGYVSVSVVQQQLKKWLSVQRSNFVIAIIFLLCSFAIYLGRYLRWNTWDILFNPAGLLFDVSERFINPSQYEQTFITTALFFLFISAVYVAFYQLNGSDTLTTGSRKSAKRNR